MTWNTIATVWLLLSAAGTVIITVGIAVWVLRHYNQDIQERESVQQLEPDKTRTRLAATASKTRPIMNLLHANVLRECVT